MSYTGARNSIITLDDPMLPQVSNRTVDVDRIERARANRREQLRQWEDFDSQHTLNTRKHIGSNRKPMVKFADNIVLLEAVARCDVTEVRELLLKKIDPNGANEDGLRALHQSCIDNHPEICAILIQHGADVNIRDAEQWTPLHAAAKCGHREVCELLIRNGADLLAVNVDGNMPYDICEEEETLTYIEAEMAAQRITQEQIDDVRLIPERTMLKDMKLLASKGASLIEFDGQGATPIHVAAACGYQEVVHYLLRVGVDPHVTNDEGWNAAHIAVCWAQPEVLELLVAYGADLSIKTREGYTVFDIGAGSEIEDRIIETWENREKLRRLAHRQRDSDFTKTRSLTRRRSTKSVERSSTRYKESLSRRAIVQELEIARNASQPQFGLGEFGVFSSPELTTSSEDYPPNKWQAQKQQYNNQQQQQLQPNSVKSSNRVKLIYTDSNKTEVKQPGDANGKETTLLVQSVPNASNNSAHVWKPDEIVPSYTKKRSSLDMSAGIITPKNETQGPTRITEVASVSKVPSSVTPPLIKEPEPMIIPAQKLLDDRRQNTDVWNNSYMNVNSATSLPGDAGTDNSQSNKLDGCCGNCVIL